MVSLKTDFMILSRSPANFRIFVWKKNTLTSGVVLGLLKDIMT